MSEVRLLILVGLLLGSLACGQQPCYEQEGTVVRIDNSLGTCNHTPDAVLKAVGRVGKNETVMLDASESTDRGGDDLSASWSLVEVPPMSVAEVKVLDALRANIKPDREGRYIVQLIVQDGTLSSKPVLHNFLVSNNPPTANAGSDASGPLDVPIILNGSGTDEDGDVLTYSWTLVERPSGSNAQLTDSTIARSSFIPDVLGLYRATLVVNDGSVDSAPDEVQIAGGAVGGPPVASAGPDSQAHLLEVVQVDGSASFDPDGDVISFQWRLVRKPDGSSANVVNGLMAVAQFTPDVIGDYEAELIVSDGVFTGRDSLRVTVAPAEPWGLGDLFDPHEMHMFMRTDPVYQSTILVSAANPRFHSFGFPRDAPYVWMNHLGRIRYFSPDPNIGGTGVFEFVEDPPDPNNMYVPPYPTAPYVNDIQVPFACIAFKYGRHVAGSDGDWVYCDSMNAWSHEDGRLFQTSNKGLAATNGDVLLFQHGRLHFVSGAPSMTAALPASRHIAARATPTGFMVALLPQGAGAMEELWEISLGGVAVQVGTYPADPSTTGIRKVLGPFGGLFSLAVDTSRKATIYKQNVDGAVDIVVEREGSMLGGAERQLITGP